MSIMSPYAEEHLGYHEEERELFHEFLTHVCLECEHALHLNGLGPDELFEACDKEGIFAMIIGEGKLFDYPTWRNDYDNYDVDLVRGVDPQC